MFFKLINKIIFLLCEYILTNEQHGFQPKWSTLANLCIFKQSILDSFVQDVQEVQVKVIYTDFEKASRKIDHSIIIYKLKLYGFRYPLLS